MLRSTCCGAPAFGRSPRAYATTASTPLSPWPCSWPPLPLTHKPCAHVGIGRAGIPRIVAHWHRRALDGRVAEGIAPVEELVDLHAAARHHLRRRLGGRRQGEHEEGVIVRDDP